MGWRIVFEGDWGEGFAWLMDYGGLGGWMEGIGVGVAGLVGRLGSGIWDWEEFICMFRLWVLGR